MTYYYIWLDIGRNICHATWYTNYGIDGKFVKEHEDTMGIFDTTDTLTIHSYLQFKRNKKPEDMIVFHDKSALDYFNTHTYFSDDTVRETDAFILNKKPVLDWRDGRFKSPPIPKNFKELHKRICLLNKKEVRL